MRPTPLTDAAVESVPMRGEYYEYREAQFIKVSELARSLERDRAELIEALRVVCKGLEVLPSIASTKALLSRLGADK
jgi:hypothetical protein